MGISSSMYAEYSNSIKEEWVNELRAAEEEEDWQRVRDILQAMDDFNFSE